MRVPWLTALLLLARPAHAWTPLAYAAERAPPDNPLRGLVPYQDSNASGFPCSLEFNYVPLKALMSGPTTFTLDAGLEPLLADVASRGHQAVFRIYVDYPDEPSGMPGFLVNNCGSHCVAMKPYNGDSGQGESPDYANTTLVAALEAAIAAVGQRYDGDPRLGFIQVGLLGHWGEWHTYPEESLMAPSATRGRILAAFRAAFTRTPYLVSADALESTPAAQLADPRLGFHDDSVEEQSLDGQGWRFWARATAQGLTGRFALAPLGGEVIPPNQESIMGSTAAADAWVEVITTTHITWLLDQLVFDSSLSSSQRARALRAVNAMGYQLAVDEVDIPAPGGPATVGVRIHNRGVAPFYGRWAPVLTAWAPAAAHATATWTTEWDLSAVQPGSTAEFHHALANPTLPAGSYELRLRVPNPLSNGKPLRFANAAQGDVDLVLGSVEVSAGGGSSSAAGGSSSAAGAPSSAGQDGSTSAVAPPSSSTEGGPGQEDPGDGSSCGCTAACPRAGTGMALLLAALWTVRSRKQ